MASLGSGVAPSSRTKSRMILHIIEAKDIAVADPITSSSDPYVAISLAAMPASQHLKSRVIKKTINPTWNQWFTLDVGCKEEVLTAEVFHYMRFGDNKSLGYVTLGIGDVTERSEKRLPLVKRHTSSIVSTGELRFFVIPVADREEPHVVFERHFAALGSQPSLPPLPSKPVQIPMSPSPSLSPSTPSPLGSSPSDGSTSQPSAFPLPVPNIVTTPSYSSVRPSTSPSVGSGLGMSSGAIGSAPRVSPARVQAHQQEEIQMQQQQQQPQQQPISGSPMDKFMRPTRSYSAAIESPKAVPFSLPRFFSMIQDGVSHSRSLSSSSNPPPVVAPPSPSMSPSGPNSPLHFALPRRQLSRRASGSHLRKESAPAATMRPLTRGLVDCFFIAGARDVLADFADRVSELDSESSSSSSPSLQQDSVLAAVDPFGMAYSGDIIDVFPPHYWDDLSPSVWMFCMPDGLILVRGDTQPAPEIFPFVMTVENGARKYVTCLKVYDQLDSETIAALSCRMPTALGVEDDSAKGALAYCPKYYCLLSSVPCFTFCREWLHSFHDAAFGPGGPCEGFCLEACLAYLRGVPLPIPAGPPLRIAFDSTELSDVQLPPAEWLPMLDVPVRVLFSSLTIDRLLLLFRCLLLEEKVFLFSRSKTLLTSACEALTTLLYPLRWSNVYAPVLPRYLLDYTHSPTPFLIGVPSSYSAEVGGITDAVRVDLDAGTVQLREGDSLPNLPPKLLASLSRDLQPFSLVESDRMDRVSWDPTRPPSPMTTAEFNDGVRASFLRFFCFLLQDYGEYCLFVRVFDKPVVELDTRRFLRSAGRDKHPFVREFIKTQAFISFLDSHKWPKVNLFDDLVGRGPRMWEESGAQLAAFLREQQMPPREPIRINLSSCLPKGMDALLIKKSNGQRDLINMEVLSVIPLPQLQSKPEIPTKRSRILSSSLGVKVDPTRKSTYVPSEHINTEEVVLAIIEGRTDELRQEQVSELAHSLELESGRVAFARALLERRGQDDTPVRKLESSSFTLLGDLLRSAMVESLDQEDFYSPQLFIEVSESYFQLSKGASDFLWKRLHNVEILQCQEFWDTYFFSKANEVCRSLYEPSIRQAMQSWHLRPPEERAKMATDEMEALWKLLSSFSFKMSSLAVSPNIIRKFSASMSNKTFMDEEHRKTFLVLVKNMSKLNDYEENFVLPSPTRSRSSASLLP